MSKTRCSACGWFFSPDAYAIHSPGCSTVGLERDKAGLWQVRSDTPPPARSPHLEPMRAPQTVFSRTVERTAVTEVGGFTDREFGQFRPKGS